MGGSRQWRTAPPEGPHTVARGTRQAQTHMYKSKGFKLRVLVPKWLRRGTAEQDTTRSTRYWKPPPTHVHAPPESYDSCSSATACHNSWGVAFSSRPPPTLPVRGQSNDLNHSLVTLGTVVRVSAQYTHLFSDNALTKHRVACIRTHSTCT